MCWWPTSPPPETQSGWRMPSQRPPAAICSNSPPADPYTDADLDWTDESSRVVREYENPEERDVALTVDTPRQLGGL